MRILVIGAGGVGSAAVGIADRRAFFEHLVVADYDPARVTAGLVQVEGDVRFSGATVDASDRSASSLSSGSTGSATSSTRSTRGS
jgi:saccharopine dehydrogenase (NAD+, L-lysine forming)